MAITDFKTWQTQIPVQGKFRTVKLLRPPKQKSLSRLMSQLDSLD